MSKVICTRENASELINGVKFSLIEGEGMVSEEISGEALELFLSIPGYALVHEEGAPVGEDQAPAQAPAKPVAKTTPAAEARAAAKAKKDAEDKAAAEQKLAEEAAAAEAEAAAAEAAKQEAAAAGTSQSPEVF